VLTLAAFAVLALLLLSGCGSSDSEGDSGEASEGSDSSAAAGTCSYPADSQPGAKEVDVPEEKPQAKGSVDATVATSAGDLAVTLDADHAPCTVNSFLSLAAQKYFDDTECHRLTTRGHLRPPVRRSHGHRVGRPRLLVRR
jgi:peptidyl-prolyl cis-trans isomerase B (cyclophilin B)